MSVSGIMNEQIAASLPKEAILQTNTSPMDDDKVNTRIALRHELLMAWAEAFWQEKGVADVTPFLALWSSEGPASPLARQRLKAGRELKSGAVYAGFRHVPCPFAHAIHHFYEQGRGVVLRQGTGAVLYTFERDGHTFDVLYVSAHYDDDYSNSIQLAFVPENQLATWAAFENK